jgi:hypothetical protein
MVRTAGGSVATAGGEDRPRVGEPSWLQRSPTYRGMTRVERWERHFEIPLLLLAAALLIAYAWPVLDPRIDRTCVRR